jgi:hypothetical protein
MQAERIRVAAGDVAGGGLVCVSLDGGGDWRRVLVPVPEVHGPHMAVTSGGYFDVLPALDLGVYVDHEWIPEKWRSGKHPRRGRRKVMVERAHTDPAVYARLLEEGRKVVHTLEFVERTRAKLARQRAEARGGES